MSLDKLYVFGKKVIRQIINLMNHIFSHMLIRQIVIWPIFIAASDFLLFGSGRVSHLRVWKMSPKILLLLGLKKSHWVESRITRVKVGTAPYLLLIRSMLE